MPSVSSLLADVPGCSDSLLINVCFDFAAEWFGINANVYELGFLYTTVPAENVTTITPTVNGLPGPLYNCSNGELLCDCTILVLLLK